jgi:hypothetical protein
MYLNRTPEQESKLDPDAKHKPGRQLTELLSRALLDEELRVRLFTDPEAIAREFDLAPAEASAVRLLDRRTFEQRVTQLRWG